MEDIVVEEAEANMPALVDQAIAGHDVIIKRNGEPVARLVRIIKKNVVYGSFKGKLTLSDDFDDPLPEDILKAFEDPEL
jgi:antitoxin (DNA-binding transcriptional repressor) of toxin-antitoxin stability system